MAASSYVEQLSGPIAGASPGGVDLEAAASAISVLGRKGIIGQQIGIRDADSQDWRGLRKEVLGHLEKTRDLRLLPYLSAAVLRTENLSAFLALFDVARAWLEGFAAGVHPLPEEDFNPRLNALTDWQDTFAVIEPLRGLAFLGSVAGAINVRDWQAAHPDKPESAGQPAPKSQQALEQEAALSAVDQALFDELLQDLQRAQDSIHQIERLVSPTPDDAGSHGDLERVSKLLKQIQDILAQELARRGIGDAAGAAAGSGEGRAGARAGAGAPLGAITSRTDALRALTEVQKFFSETEPSSPVPLLVERVKRLVDSSFLEVLEELLPDRVNEAKQVAGVRDSDR